MGPTRRVNRAFFSPYRPRKVPDGWTEQRLRLRNNKEVFDEELFTIHRTMGILERRRETGLNYTIFSDSMTAIERVMTDRCGPGQALAKAIIEPEELLSSSSCSIAIRWTVHKGVEGNEVAESYAGGWPKHTTTRVGQGYLREASFVHLSHKTAEAKSYEHENRSRAMLEAAEGR